MQKKDNLQEYDNPSLYDFENDGYTADVSFLLNWAEGLDGTIVDLACGTGRASIPLAEKGHNLIGVDIHTGMLDEARKKSGNLPIKWLEQDCTRLYLDTQSPFIYMVGNSFQHFLSNDDQDAMLTSVHNHLLEDGVFIFNTRFPSREELLQPETEEFWRSYVDPDTRQNIDVYTISKYDSLQQIQHYTTIRRASDGMESITNISLRYVYPKELERLAKANGFRILHLYKDWNRSPLTEDSYEMICVLQKVK
ncbi:class I SAM-dependent DNA methyltransferase [Ornithinibacillus californiensis]|uniref:class I SAM-dependent DNA methyltransferase n=1 Tax=Ornithinibacillus californiensis TaxID=161536 RepID=UPI00064E0D68|nr:class I SAM-dependent methyltransferase [Ornithinibacillus californiensis]